MEIRSNLTYGAVKKANDANEAYVAKKDTREDKLSTGLKMNNVSADAASLEIKAKPNDATESALENVNASSSAVEDVLKAAGMIQKANRRILENSDDSVLAQANQTTDVVTKLLD